MSKLGMESHNILQVEVAPTDRASQDCIDVLAFHRIHQVACI